MKKLIKKIALISSAILLLSSCDEQVDLTNPTAFTLEDLLQIEDGFLLLSNGVMDAYQKVVSNEYLINELRSDNAISNTLIGSISEINSYTLTATEGNSANYYSNNYQTIAKANQIIENRFLAPEEYQYTVGEAFFMRALCHFNAVRAFLNVPYIDKTLDVATEEILQYPQLDPSEVYSKIIEDFKTSIAFLELSPSSSAYRPNKNAAIALLAKAYLSQPNPNYAEAESLLNSLIGQNSLVYTSPTTPIIYDNGVSTDVNHIAVLTADFASVFGNGPSEDYNFATSTYDGAWDNFGPEANSEIMFSIAFEADNAEDGDVTSADPDLDDQVETDSEIFSFDQSGGGQSNGVNIASLDFLRVMNKDVQPVRLEGTLLPAGISDVLLAQDLDTEIFNNKYPVKTVGEGRGNGNDWVIMRYADVLLLYAEAILAGSDQTTNGQAIAAFDQVRERAGLQPIQNNLLTKAELLAERRVEFAYENQRLFDLIRFGEVDNVLSAHSVENSLNYSPPKAYLPFPQREIDATNGFYDQNPGY